MNTVVEMAQPSDLSVSITEQQMITASEVVINDATEKCDSNADDISAPMDSEELLKKPHSKKRNSNDKAEAAIPEQPQETTPEDTPEERSREESPEKLRKTEEVISGTETGETEPVQNAKADNKETESPISEVEQPAAENATSPNPAAE